MIKVSKASKKETFPLIFQILAYVSQVHKIVLPEDLIDHDTLTLDQVLKLIFIFMYVQAAQGFLCNAV